MTEPANTSMSSTVHNWTSDLAIDGNVGPDPDACHCCSGTQNSQTSWWMVDMGKRFPVNLITVYSRRNEQTFQQLTDFQLYFANGTKTYSYVLIGNNTRKILGTKHELTFPSIVTRYIKIQRPGILTLCEVRVYGGECPVGTFGDECLQRCHCADERACDEITGRCRSPACKTGWIGIACNKREKIELRKALCYQLYMSQINANLIFQNVHKIPLEINAMRNVSVRMVHVPTIMVYAVDNVDPDTLVLTVMKMEDMNGEEVKKMVLEEQSRAIPRNGRGLKQLLAA
ncbi:uncharacterized protein LOC128551883 [Mercenaria mercenaria]|uniref:uncharacterized protein LOC128551883 n=1 Tax=Mercenaria mercenaria TaxID=6596 RepID=UPI00234F17FC|nr:uncharacterized protein LOC128551883 [Mercenaria mercenaria]